MLNPMKQLCVCTALALPLLILHSGVAQANIDPLKVQKLLAEDGTSGDWLGYSVSVSNNIALIGARGDQNQTGAAYIFVRTDDGTWQQKAKLTADDGVEDARFGYSVSLSGNTALIGALYDDEKGEHSGSAYVFVRDEDCVETQQEQCWHQQAKLTADDGISGDVFGISVSLDGNNALVGAGWHNNGAGAAYVFVRSGDTWTQQEKLTVSDGTALARFGQSVSISGDTSLIGSFYDSATASQSGSAYVFVRDKDCLEKQQKQCWHQQQKLVADDGAAGDYFGSSVSVDEKNKIALIGAILDDDKGFGAGSAYVFIRDKDGSWQKQAKLTADDGEQADFFGNSVSVSKDTALIGARTETGNSGSAYLFVRDKDGAWHQQEQLIAADSAGDFFGWSVSLSGKTALIGGYTDDDKGRNAGAAWLYQLH
jgi:hypothetical protein